MKVGEEESNPESRLFYMDLVPSTGVGLYLSPTGAQDEMTGGLFKWDGETTGVLTRDKVFPHNIEPFEGGYILTDTDLDAVFVVDDSGAAIRSFGEIKWLDGQSEPMLHTNWALPLSAAAAERFLGPGTVPNTTLLICKGRTAGEETWMWWSICEIEDGVLRSLWEMKSPGRKAHAGVLHQGVFYGASSATGTLVVVGASLDFELPVGNIRYMEIVDGALWMAGDGFVWILDNLPPEPDAVPRVFVQDIGQAQAVHVSGDRVFVTANGFLLVFDHDGRQLESLGSASPERGESWIHDRLRSLGYLE